jgi:hypothetical protein
MTKRQMYSHAKPSSTCSKQGSAVPHDRRTINGATSEPNFTQHLKVIRWRTPFEPICLAGTTTPDSFKFNPHHVIPGLEAVMDLRLVERPV